MREVRNIIQEGVDHFHAGRLDQAEFIFDRLAAKYPNDGIIQGYLGAVASKTGKHGTAISLLSSAVTTMLADGIKAPGVWSNLGSVLKRECHVREAEAAFLQALEYDPENVHTLSNYSGMFINAGQPEKAEALAREAIRVYESQTDDTPLLVLEIEGQEPMKTSRRDGGDESSYKLAKHHLALACLEQDKWPEGWSLYDNRKFIEGWQRPTYPIKYWEGEPCDTLLIHGEQGLGDEIMYLSLVPRLRDRAKRIIVECNHRLIPLVRRSLGLECFPNIEAVQAAGIVPDRIIAMGSLPNVLKLERKDALTDGYLRPDADRVEYWRTELKRRAQGRPIITLAWKGGLPQTHKELRNPPRDLFKTIDPAKYFLVSVQYTPQAEQQARELGAFHYQPAIDDIDEQCAVIAASDCLVTVAQTAMHLAGASSTPCLALIASKPRWDCIGETDAQMPWWKSINCIRQRGQDWADVFVRLNKELEERYAPSSDRAAAE